MVTMASAYIAFLCMFVVTTHAKLSTKELLDTLILTTDHKKDAFLGLDVKRDSIINMKDMDVHYFHKAAGFAKTKFMDLIDIKTKDGKITEDEMNSFLEDTPVTAAVWECTYVRSDSLRQYCFADQILTYVYLVLDNASVEKFFNYIESQTDDNTHIDAVDVAKLAALNKKFTAAEQDNFLQEIGGPGKIITLEAFRKYAKQEDLQNDFRQCRIEFNGCLGVYNDECLTLKLMHYTMEHLTEMDIAVVFGELDHKDTRDETSLVKEDLLKNSYCSEAVADRFITIMDRTGDRSVSYGEFRTYLKRPSVKMHLENDCSEPKQTQAEEIVCYKEKIANLAADNHRPIWMDTADLDMLTLFDELDHNNDGQIKVMDDLVNVKKWDKDLALKFVAEMDGADEDVDVNLEEFTDYVNEPNMVYGLSDCYSSPFGNDRLVCHENRLKALITHVFEHTKIEPFYAYYDTNGDRKITQSDLTELKFPPAQAEKMLKEMGMGDDQITMSEFKWFVRQLEVSKLFEACDKTPAALNPILQKFIAEYMTEYVIELLFVALDTDKNFELECSDFGATSSAIVHLLEVMDKNGDNKVNFYEFRTYLVSPLDNPRKKQLEKSCTKPESTQQAEIRCYKREIVNVN